MSKKVSEQEQTKSPNVYIQEIIDQKKKIPVSIDNGHVQTLLGHIKEWAGSDFADAFLSGSSAKGTALIGSSDVDLFISMNSSLKDRLEDNFQSLAELFRNKEIKFLRQNVSIRVWYHSLQIDVVPGKKKPRSRHRHTLYMYREKNQNRIETNVQKHIKYVLDSNRINEILAMKIWRDLNKIPLSSMYLEMYTIHALKGKWSSRKFLSRNFLFVLEHMAEHFKSTIINDPCNASNRISNDLLQSDKDIIQNAARQAMTKEYLGDLLY